MARYIKVKHNLRDVDMDTINSDECAYIYPDDEGKDILENSSEDRDEAPRGSCCYEVTCLRDQRMVKQ